MGAKVSRGFANLPDPDLDNFLQTIINSITGNASYPSPPVTIVALQAARDDFTAKISAAQVGGPADTAAKNAQRQVVLGMLNQLVLFVQLKCNGDLTVLLTSGF